MMKRSNHTIFAAACAMAALLAGCATTPKRAGNPDPPAYRPHNPEDVEVKVSLGNRAVYVLENGRPLLVAATCGGKPGTPTPTGHFHVFFKNRTKRSNTYGYHVYDDGRIIPGKSSDTPSGARYVGYPMPYWVEFKSGYGLHQGSVHPVGRSHGCLRLHKNVAHKFFSLVRDGTPISIAQSQPEDLTIGRDIPWPTDYADPDPPGNVMISAAAVEFPPRPVFAN